PVSHDDDRFTRDLANDEIARIRETVRTANAIPLAREDAVALGRENRGIGVRFARHRSRAAAVCGDGLVKRWPGCFTRGERAGGAASHPGPPITPGPGCEPAPPRYNPSIGVEYRARPGTGRMNRI